MASILDSRLFAFIRGFFRGIAGLVVVSSRQRNIQTRERGAPPHRRPKRMQSLRSPSLTRFYLALVDDVEFSPVVSLCSTTG